MNKFRSLAMVALLLIAVQPGFAENHEQIIGVWKMVSFEWEMKDSGDRIYPWGMTPSGYLIYAPEGRSMVTVYKGLQIGCRQGPEALVQWIGQLLPGRG